jgi:SynChlorMet cassette radical SAM/SPASM protein ScmF
VTSPQARISRKRSESDLSNDFPLTHIYFYISKICNLRCEHCWIEARHASHTPDNAFLPTTIFEQVIDQAKELGLKTVRLTGGEPLLHPDFLGILEVVRWHDLGLLVETNATACSDTVAESIARCDGATVAASIDGATAASHELMRGTPGSLQAAEQGIARLTRRGISVQLIMTMTTRNKDQIAAVVILAEKVGASSVKFNILQPTGRGRALHAKGVALSTAEIVELSQWVNHELSNQTKLDLYFNVPAAFRPLGHVFGEGPRRFGFCGVKEIIGVLSNGSYALCGIGEAVPELVFGDSRVDALSDVWRTHPTLLSIRRDLPARLEGICKLCLLSNLCLGSCIAQNYFRESSLWAPFWFCQNAHEQGLFPQSRLKHPK